MAELISETAEAGGHPPPVRRVLRFDRTPTPTRSSSPAPASRLGVISVPNRYMHSPNEIVDLDDLENAAPLAAAAARRLDASA